ncbi:hypothetical protein [Photobacterium swingsii]|uniref:hypothetical protein n=1 Tax=Photobacterium swingsii TaxID=680026 RepID=UPI0040681894
MLYDIVSFVGVKRKNNVNDVRLLQALFNVYIRMSGGNPLTINGKCSDDLIDMIALYQKVKLKTPRPRDYVEPNGKVIKSLNDILRSVFKPVSVESPKFGLLTWTSEGNEGGRYHSRKLHVPSESSGVTIGRGYDLRRKKITTVRRDLASAGLKPEVISKLVKAIGLNGRKAKKFIIHNDLIDYQVTPSAQLKLFKASYDFEASEVKRICSKPLVIKRYGSTDWERLNPTIKEVTIDLKFRGDYTPAIRQHLQETIANNDLQAFKKVIRNRGLWARVPGDRFQKRIKYVQ